MTRIIVNKSTDHAKPHFNLFFTTISTSKKMFFSEHELRKLLGDTLTRAVLSRHSYQQSWQISQSDCEISNNCGKKKTFYEIKMQVVWHYCYLSYGIEETAGLLAFSVNVKFPLSSNLEGMRSYHVFLNHCNLWSFKCHKETILYIHDYAQACSVFP